MDPGLIRSSPTLVLVVIICSGFFCSQPDEIPTLSADCTGQTFHLYGEITSLWKASVDTDQDYEVVVTGGSDRHRISDLYIGVTDGEINYIGTDTHYVSPDAILEFSSGDLEKIYIRVTSKIGAGNEDLGRYEIKLCINAP